MASTKIVVLDGYTLNPGDNPWPSLDGIGELTAYDRTSREELLERAISADILLTNKTVLDKETLAQLPRLKFIAVLATGYNVVDVAAARQRGIPVSNVPTYGTDTVSQFAFAQILELCHHIGQHAASVAQGDWNRSPDWTYWKSPQVELSGKTLGIVGFGRIGQRTGAIGNALGMHILFNTLPPFPAVDYPAQSATLEKLFSEADVIALHCALNDSNFEFVNKTLLQRMKPTAFLVNNARGQLVNAADLAQALRDGVLAGAALDVLAVEPPKVDNPLLHAPNCLITPHIAWASLEARQRITQTTLVNIRAFLSGTPINVVNPAQ
jgi:glycerate dehydrogenase